MLIRTLKILFPPYVIVMILYVQIVFLTLNYKFYDARELLIYICWIPIFTIPCFFLKKQIFYKIVVLIFFIEGFLNLSHLLILKGPITASSLFVLSNTNFSEAKEFMELKMSFIQLLIVPYIFLFLIAFRNKYSVHIYRESKWIIIILLLFSTIFIAENLIHGRIIRKGVPQTAKAFISFTNELQHYKDLKKRKIKNIATKHVTTELQEHLFVLIIGESCNKNHMSLYNYPRKTNPRLEKRQDIIVYSDVVSPYSNTLNSILTLLTESNLENNLSFDKSISLIDVYHSAGFQTFWLSNQAPIGVWDNYISNLAQTSDISIFVNNKGNTSFENTYISSYDEKLIQPFSSILKGKERKKFIVIHLMGSHSKYAKRYPNNYNKFTIYHSHKEKIINEYDNSILYNDFVIDTIFSILNAYSSDHDNIIASAIYLSDHGENVYDENNNVGHGYSGSLPKANVEIPFIVWLSSGYKHFYQNKINTILINRDKPFITDDLFHTIMDLNDIECNAYIKTRSLFNKDFNFSRLRILEDKMNYDLK